MGLLNWLFGTRALREASDAAAASRLAGIIERGIGLHESGRLVEAETLYREVLAADPRNADALHLLGVVQHQRGDHTAALLSINAAIPARPSSALFHFNLGNLLVALDETEAAADSFSEATRLNPRYPAAWFNLGKARLAMKKARASVPALRHAFELAPDLPGLRSELCTALLTLGDETPEEMASFKEASALLQDHWQGMEHPGAARLMLAYGIHQQGRWTEAEAHYRGVLAGTHTLEEELKAHSNLANCCNQLGLISEAIHHYRETLRLNPEFADTASSIAACLNYDPSSTPADVLAAHRDWSRRFAAGLHYPAKTWDPNIWSRDPERRLRIGYVSPDFRRHPVTALFAPIIERHDRDRFEVYCYYNHRGSDGVTARIRAAAGHWRDVAGIEHADLANAIAEDRIDILVDLAGHTAHNRLPVFARKPAPVQVEWLGYFNTTGIDAFDYFLSDPHCSPPGQEQWFTETLLRLPRTRFCYEAHAFMPEVNALPALSRGSVTFGCFNNLAKLNPDVLKLWSRILREVPGSRLVIQAQALDDAPNRERFAVLADDCGIARERVELRPFVPLEEAARTYHGIDIALDPFPFCGGMTSFEALWMGVPVVTREAPLIAGRQTLSMLANLGLGELVGRDDDDYARIAVRLATDLAALATLRRDLRPRFAASPLMDYAGFTAALESAYRQMWRRWAGGHAGA